MNFFLIEVLVFIVIFLSKLSICFLEKLCSLLTVSLHNKQSNFSHSLQNFR